MSEVKSKKEKHRIKNNSPVTFKWKLLSSNPLWCSIPKQVVLAIESVNGIFKCDDWMQLNCTFPWYRLVSCTGWFKFWVCPDELWLWHCCLSKKLFELSSLCKIPKCGHSVQIYRDWNIKMVLTLSLWIKYRNGTTQMTITEKFSCGAVSYVVKGGYNESIDEAF